MQAYGDFAGSNRKSMEVGGSQWKELQKAGRFRWIHGRFHYFGGSSNYFDGRFHQHARLFFMYEENDFLRFVKLAKMYQDTEAFCHKLWNLTEEKTPGKFIFTNLEKNRTIYKIKKMCAKVYASCRLSLVSRVYVVYYYLDLGGRTWGYIVMTQIPDK